MDRPDSDDFAGWAGAHYEPATWHEVDAHPGYRFLLDLDAAGFYLRAERTSGGPEVRLDFPGPDVVKNPEDLETRLTEARAEAVRQLDARPDPCFAEYDADEEYPPGIGCDLPAGHWPDTPHQASITWRQDPPPPPPPTRTERLAERLGRTPTDQELADNALDDARTHGWPGDLDHQIDCSGMSGEIAVRMYLREAVGFGWVPADDDTRSRKLIKLTGHELLHVSRFGGIDDVPALLLPDLNTVTPRTPHGTGLYRRALDLTRVAPGTDGLYARTLRTVKRDQDGAPLGFGFRSWLPPVDSWGVPDSTGWRWKMQGSHEGAGFATDEALLVGRHSCGYRSERIERIPEDDLAAADDQDQLIEQYRALIRTAGHPCAAPGGPALDLHSTATS